MEHTWSARSLRPAIAGYVAMVFCGFMAMAGFVFHSPGAVKTLFFTMIGSLASLVPSLFMRVEYRLTETGLAKRISSQNEPREFRELFRWDELSHLVPTRSGFKYFKELDETRGVARFFKLHFSGDHSGEFHVEPEDLPEVRSLVEQRTSRLAKPD